MLRKDIAAREGGLIDLSVESLHQTVRRIQIHRIRFIFMDPEAFWSKSWIRIRDQNGE